MRGRPFGWFRLAWQKILLAISTPSAAQSTLTTSSFTGASFTWTYTARDASGNLLSGVPVVFTVDAEALIDAAASVVTANPAAIDNDGVATSTITVALVDTDADPVVGWATASNVLAATGTGNTLTQPAAVSTIGGLQTGTLKSTNAATKVVSSTVASLAITDTASVVVGTPVADLTPVFFSDWATASLGTAAIDRTDGGKWDGPTIPTGGAVVASTGLDFPAGITQVHRVDWAVWSYLRTDTLSVPAVGDTRYYRWYFRRVANTITLPGENHCFQDGASGGTHNWLTAQVESSATQWRLDMRPSTTANSYPAYRWIPTILLDKDATYRIEVAVTRTASTTMQMSARVYNSANTLVLSDADFYREDSGGSVSLADSPTFNIYLASVFGGLNAGNNNNQPSENLVYSYEGGFAVCDNQGWIGAYGSVAGEA